MRVVAFGCLSRRVLVGFAAVLLVGVTGCSASTSGPNTRHAAGAEESTSASGVVPSAGTAPAGLSAQDATPDDGPSLDGALTLTVTTSVVEVESVASPGSWVPASVVHEGSPARVSVTFDALQAHDVDVSVTLPGADSALGEASVSVPAGVSTVTVPLSIGQAAWLPAADGPHSGGDHMNLTVTTRPDAAAKGDAAAYVGEIPVAIAPRPVIFVHGMWESASWWDAYTKPGGFLSSTHPEWEGFAVDTMNTGSSWTPLAAVNTIEENAALAWAFIEARMRETNAHQMDVVAHSLGGVITRRMLHDTDYGAKARDAIRTVILLGTPNGGSPCSDALIVPANRELTIPAMTAFNEDYPGYPGVNSVSLYSDHWSTTCFAAGAGDSMVPAWSAQAQPVDTTQRITPGVDHASMTSDSRAYHDYVKPFLESPATDPGRSVPSW